MGLEAATFINQLNPLNPVGAVDPKSQGDDHLRLIKSTLQASFPNITGAMTATQAQLNQWSGLGGAYPWTGQHSWAIPLRAPDGTAPAPAYTFGNDLDTGFYRISNNEIGVSANGVLVMDINSTDVRIAHSATAKLALYIGGAERAFFQYDNAGVVARIDSDGALQLAANNVVGLTLTAVANPAAQFQDGTTALPSVTFNTDPDSGFYRAGANNLRIAAGAIDILGFANVAGTAFLQPFGVLQGVVDGTVGTPLYSFNNDPDTGMYRSGTNTVALVGNGAIGLQVDGTGAYLPDGTNGSPGLKFNSDTDTGFYRIGADLIGFAEGGTGYRVGFRDIPRSTTTTNLVSNDSGRCVAVTAAINIPASTFGAGSAVSIYNDSAAAVNITISAGTLRLGGSTSTGTRTLAARGMATLWFNVGGATPEVICTGAGVS